jgi:hypothetical protein
MPCSFTRSQSAGQGLFASPALRVRPCTGHRRLGSLEDLISGNKTCLIRRHQHCCSVPTTVSAGLCRHLETISKSIRRELLCSRHPKSSAHKSVASQFRTLRWPPWSMISSIGMNLN